VYLATHHALPRGPVSAATLRSEPRASGSEANPHGWPWDPGHITLELSHSLFTRAPYLTGREGLDPKASAFLTRPTSRPAPSRARTGWRSARWCPRASRRIRLASCARGRSGRPLAPARTR